MVQPNSMLIRVWRAFAFIEYDCGTSARVLGTHRKIFAP